MAAIHRTAAAPGLAPEAGAPDLRRHTGPRQVVQALDLRFREYLSWKRNKYRIRGVIRGVVEELHEQDQIQLGINRDNDKTIRESLKKIVKDSLEVYRELDKAGFFRKINKTTIRLPRAELEDELDPQPVRWFDDRSNPIIIFHGLFLEPDQDAPRRVCNMCNEDRGFIDPDNQPDRMRQWERAVGTGRRARQVATGFFDRRTFPECAATHAFDTCCIECSGKWVKAQHAIGLPLKCFYFLCEVEFDGYQVKEILDPRSFATWDEQVKTRFLQQQAGFRWCLAPRCGAGAIHEDAVQGSRCAVKCRKESCERRMCFSHQILLGPPPDGQDEENSHDCGQCSAEGTGDRPKAPDPTEGFAKRCPHCNIPIQKMIGLEGDFASCDDIKCSFCKQHFYWKCGELPHPHRPHLDPATGRGPDVLMYG